MVGGVAYQGPSWPTTFRFRGAFDLVSGKSSSDATKRPADTVDRGRVLLLKNGTDGLDERCHQCST